MSGSQQRKTSPPRPSRAVVARVVRGHARETESRFTATFTVGRGQGCEVQLLDAGVAQSHVQVVFDGMGWWARNLAADGTYVDGAEIQMMPLQGTAELEVGKGGPVLSLTIQDRAQEPVGRPAASRAVTGYTSPDQIVSRLRAPAGVPIGKQTMMMRRAFAEVQRSSSRRYQVAIAVAASFLICAGGVIRYQQQKLRALRGTAERLFYATRSVELQTARLEEEVLLHADPRQLAELKERRTRLRQMEREYDAFVQELSVYAKASDEEKLILRVARLFGECEVNVPPGFVAEVQRHVQRWKTTERLRFTSALQRAKQRGYAAGIARTLAESNLPPQYLFLALQESNFEDRAVGPATRYGYAKGMWQFISSTGQRYGLRIGPLHDQRVFDAEDERFEWQKATAAAAKYIKELSETEAQGSGLLVMASYNWGERNLRGIIEKLPANPRDRNFWRLLADRSVPRETYGYVLSIFSAAVICEDPALFGFAAPCP